MGEPQGMAGAGSSAGPSDDELAVARVVNTYSPPGAVARLRFITQTARTSARRQAYLRLIETIQEHTCSVDMYSNVVNEAISLYGPSFVPVDTTWVSNAKKVYDKTMGIIQRDITAAASSLVKENSRRENMEMGNFLYFKAVEFANATGAFHKATHYCSTSKHVIDYCLGVVRASLMADLFRTIPPLLVKADSKIESREAASRRDTGAGAGGGAHGGAGAGSGSNSAAAEAAAAETATMRAQVHACFGIVHMHSGAFRSAATALCVVPPGKIGDGFRDVTVDADVALYAGVCALASMTRDELLHSVLTSPLFNAEACLEPLVRRSIEDFCASRYDRCLATMNQFRNRLRLDMYATVQVDTLLKRIRAAAIVQYFAPYSKVSMVAMATAFNTTVEELEAELLQLITAEKLHARIDSHLKVLHARTTDKRAQTYRAALDMGRDYIVDMKTMLFRVNLERKGVKVTMGRQRGAGGGDGSGAAADGEGIAQDGSTYMEDTPMGGEFNPTS